MLWSTDNMQCKPMVSLIVGIKVYFYFISWWTLEKLFSSIFIMYHFCMFISFTYTLQERDSYWKMMQKYVGSDITSMVTLPVIIFEPMTILQKMAEVCFIYFAAFVFAITLTQTI